MNVKELRELLAKFPDHLPVASGNHDDEYSPALITQHYLTTLEHVEGGALAGLPGGADVLVLR